MVKSRKYNYIFFFSAIVISISMYLFSILIDPFGESQTKEQKLKIFASSVLTIDRYLKQLSEKKYTLIFGTSRSNLISSEQFGGPVLNLHVVYGNPYSVSGFLERLEGGHLKNVSEIYYLLDFFTFDGVERAHKKIEYKSLLDRFMYRFSNLGNYFWVAISTVKSNLISDYSYYITIDGSRKNVADSEREPEFRLIHGLELYTNITFDALEQLGMIEKFCKRNNLKITYFTPPPSPIHFKTLLSL